MQHERTILLDDHDVTQFDRAYPYGVTVNGRGVYFADKDERDAYAQNARGTALSVHTFERDIPETDIEPQADTNEEKGEQ